jgi:hypothetical protein
MTLSISTPKVLVRSRLPIVCCLLIGLVAFLAASDLSASVLRQSPKAPSLPPPKVGLTRTSPAVVLEAGNLILGRTELVAFMSTDGLCVEVDHIPHRTRAGGCEFRPLPTDRSIFLSAQGYSKAVGEDGITELIGQVSPAARSIRVEYRRGHSWIRQKVLFGYLPAAVRPDAATVSPAWFATNLPGCVQGRNIRVRAFGIHHSYLGDARGLQQNFACRAGMGYKVRGGITYGALPTRNLGGDR